MRKKHCLIHLSACRLAPLPHKASVNTVLLHQLLCVICPVIHNICHFSGIVFTRKVK